MPGEPENINRTERKKDGIPLTKITWEAIKDTSKQFNISNKLIRDCEK